MATLNQQISVGDPGSTPLPHPLTICSPSSSEVPLGPQFCSCSPQHKNTLWGQPWSRELSLGQSLDCHYLQEKKKSLVLWQVAPQGILVDVGSRHGQIWHGAGLSLPAVDPASPGGLKDRGQCLALGFSGVSQATRFIPHDGNQLVSVRSKDLGTVGCIQAW